MTSCTNWLYFCRIRATFGQNVGPFRKQVGSGVEFYFEGMSSKTTSTNVPSSTAYAAERSPTPTPISIEVPGSPILKAQLCAPPKANNRKEAPKQASLFFEFGFYGSAQSPFLYFVTVILFSVHYSSYFIFRFCCFFLFLVVGTPSFISSVRSRWYVAI